VTTASRSPVALIDRAVVLVAITRIIPLATAPVTWWLIATTRPISEQGAYFIFWNAQALTQLMEIGVGALLVQFASHEAQFIVWSSDGHMEGDASAQHRLFALISLGTRWYAGVALGVLVIAGIGGTWLLTDSFAPVNRGITVPWLVTVICIAAYLPLVPVLCAIEGSGGLIQLQKMRLLQVSVATVILWLVMVAWGALWGVAAFAVVWYLTARLWLRSSYGGLLREVAAASSKPRGSEPDGLAEGQWRTAVTWLAWWALPQTLTPIVLSTFGPTAAGQVGMSLAIATAPLTLAASWLYGRYPSYGLLVASRRVQELRRLARIATIQAALVCAAGTVAVACVVWALPRVSPELSRRLLPASAVVTLGFGNLAWLCLQSLGTYLRAWRMDPLPQAAVVGAMVISVGTLVAASMTTVFGTIVVHVVGVVVCLLPLSWLSSRAARARAMP
jgi:hypothetical protein